MHTAIPMVFTFEAVAADGQPGGEKFSRVKDDALNGNLMLIDTLLPRMLAHVLADSMQSGVTALSALIERTEAADPLALKRKGVYGYKLERFVRAVSCGMRPGAVWDGRLPAVKADADDYRLCRTAGGRYRGEDGRTYFDIALTIERGA